MTALALLPAEPVLACAACGTQKAENDWAFGLTTVFLSLLPPLLLGGFVFFIVRMSRRAARGEEQQLAGPAALEEGTGRAAIGFGSTSP